MPLVVQYVFQSDWGGRTEESWQFLASLFPASSPTWNNDAGTFDAFGTAAWAKVDPMVALRHE